MQGQRDFTTPALVTLFAYFVFYVPGLIANLVYLHQAKEELRTTGIRPTGLLFLEWLRYVFIYVPLGFLGFGAVVAIIAVIFYH